VETVEAEVQAAKDRVPRFSVNRRNFLRLTAAAGAVALAADAVLLAPNFPRVVYQEIALARWPARMDGFTLAMLSDFHYDSVFSVHPIRAAVDLVRGLRPELIVLTGDFVSVPLVGDSARGAIVAEPCAELLSHMQAPFGLWAVTGNHDSFTAPHRVKAALRANGIRVLENHAVPIERDNARFWLAGVDDILGRTSNLPAALGDIPSGEAAVLLAHEPDFADYASRFPVDLQLSGHSHGGQVRLPYLPPLYLPDMAKKYILGRYQVGNLKLYTNPGIGTVGVPMRFDCPPEVTIIKLRRG